MVNWPIIIVIVSQESIHPRQNITNIGRLQSIIANHIFEDIPHTFDHIQIIYKNVINRVPETRVSQLLRLQHLLDYDITHCVEHVFGQLFYPGQFPEIVQFFHIQDIAHIEGSQHLLRFVDGFLRQSRPRQLDIF